MNDEGQPPPGPRNSGPVGAVGSVGNPGAVGSVGAPGAVGSAADDARVAALLRRAARGDEDAFAQLYDAVSARVYGLVLRVVRAPAQAEEVTQEAFLDVWRHSARFDDSRGAAIPWILTIAHRRAVDRVRAAEAETRRNDQFARRDEVRPHDATVEAAEGNLDRARVTKALGSLTPIQRDAIELAYFGGYTHTEVARMLDLPLGTAKTRIRDGLIRLRDTLGVEL